MKLRDLIEGSNAEKLVKAKLSDTAGMLISEIKPTMKLRSQLGLTNSEISYMISQLIDEDGLDLETPTDDVMDNQIDTVADLIHYVQKQT